MPDFETYIVAYDQFGNTDSVAIGFSENGSVGYDNGLDIIDESYVENDVVVRLDNNIVAIEYGQDVNCYNLKKDYRNYDEGVFTEMGLIQSYIHEFYISIYYDNPLYQKEVELLGCQGFDTTLVQKVSFNLIDFFDFKYENEGGWSFSFMELNAINVLFGSIDATYQSAALNTLSECEEIFFPLSVFPNSGNCQDIQVNTFQVKLHMKNEFILNNSYHIEESNIAINLKNNKISIINNKAYNHIELYNIDGKPVLSESINNENAAFNINGNHQKLLILILRNTETNIISSRKLYQI